MDFFPSCKTITWLVHNQHEDIRQTTHTGLISYRWKQLNTGDNNKRRENKYLKHTKKPTHRQNREGQRSEDKGDSNKVWTVSAKSKQGSEIKFNQEMETIIYSNHSRRWSLGEWLQQSLKTYNLALTTGKLAQCFRIADMGVLFWKEFAHGVDFHCCAAIWVQYVHSHFHTCSLKQWLTLRELLLHVMLPMAGDPLGCHHPWKEWEH